MRRGINIHTQLPDLLHEEPTVMRFLDAAPELRTVFVDLLIPSPGGEQPEILAKWKSVHQRFEKRGVQLLQSVKNMRYNPDTQGPSSRFDETRPFSLTTRKNLVKLQLWVGGIFPVDLHALQDISFPRLEYLDLRLHYMTPSHAFAIVFSRFRLPNCKSIKLSVLPNGGQGERCDSLMWTLVSLIPVLPSLEKLDIEVLSAPFDPLAETALTRLCGKKDIQLKFKVRL